MIGLLQEALPVSTLVVAIDPGKVAHRVWLSTGEQGPVAEPRSLPVLRAGIDELDRLVRAQKAPAFAGRPPILRSLRARARGRLGGAEAEYWTRRWRECLSPPPDADARAQRLGRSVARWRAVMTDIAAVDDEIETLLAATDGQILTTLPGVKTVRAAAFAAFSLPIDRFADADRLYSATGLAPAHYQSSTLTRRGRISRQGLAEHRDALMSIAWGLSRNCAAFRDRDRELRARGMAPIQARVALARHACRLCFTLLRTQRPFDEQRYRQARHQRER